MDVSVFKANRRRLTSWIVIPPVLAVSVGLSSYALRRHSQWELSRAQEMAGVLPQLVQTRQIADDVLSRFNGDGESDIHSEDQLISLIQETGRRVGFTVDSLKVERRVSARHRNLPVLTAAVTGEGQYADIEFFLGEVCTQHHFLSASSVKLSKSQKSGTQRYRADIGFELVLLEGLQVAGGGETQ